jgi:hypothetical protein
MLPLGHHRAGLDHGEQTAMERKKVGSSTLRSVGYDSRARVLEVEFASGAIVQYLSVSADVHRAMMNASSIASFFRDRIEDEGYGTRRVR